MGKFHTPTNHEIRALRSRLEMSQPEMAELLMCSPATISKWEQGVNTMPPMVWHAAQIIVAKAEEDATPTQERLTVYDKKKADREAEEQKKLEAKERYEQRRLAIEQEYADRKARYLEHFRDIQARVARHRPQAMTDFEGKLEGFYDVAQSIGQLENYYFNMYKKQIDELTQDMPPYVRFREAHPDAFIS